ADRDREADDRNAGRAEPESFVLHARSMRRGAPQVMRGAATPDDAGRPCGVVRCGRERVAERR
ncbi:hypothetical protein, partial [Burkholderia sp. E168m30]|uniref:hypothetical protein n=1 Tax=Burkholderia sp. E168m30 TaxID=1561201 RepID=UPI001F3A0AF0